VILLSVLRYVCIEITGGDVADLLVSVSLMASGWPSATVGYVPTIFVGWGVDLVCRVFCLLVYSVRFICA